MATVKKAAIKKAAKSASKADEKISVKVIGSKYIGKIDGKTLSASLNEKDATDIKKKVEIYNKRPTEATKKAIIKLLSPKTVEKAEKKEKLEMASKGIKKLAKKQAKKASKEEKEVTEAKKLALGDIQKAIEADDVTVAELEKLLSELKKVNQAVPTAETTKSPYSGEHYRRGY